MSSEDNIFYLLAVLISNCRLLLFKFEEFQICKIKRQQNKCADILAKEARNTCLSQDPMIILSLPTKNTWKTFLPTNFVYHSYFVLCFSVLFNFTPPKCGLLNVASYIIINVTFLFHKKKNNNF